MTGSALRVALIACLTNAAAWLAVTFGPDLVRALGNLALLLVLLVAMGRNS